MTTTSSLPRTARTRFLGPRKGLLLGATVAVVGLVLGGCSGGDSSAQTVNATPDASAATAVPSPDVERTDAAGSAVSGLIAAVADSVAQVQSTGAQTAVTWTDETAVLVTSATDLSAVTVGSCVAALPAATTDDGSATQATVSGVVVSEPVDGECTVLGSASAGRGATGAQGEAGGQARPTDQPADRPTDRPSRGADAQAAGGPGGGSGPVAVVTGQVTAVDGSTITITTTDRDGTAGEATVTLGADTTYQQTLAAGTDRIAVGWCTTARGTADDRGGLSAETMTLSEAVDGVCAEVGNRG